MASLWNWAELVRRAQLSGVLENKQLFQFFEGYLRFRQDDHQARLWVQDLIVEAEFRTLAGDPFPHHPTQADGISNGDITLGMEAHNNTPYRCHMKRGPACPGTPVINSLVAGSVGAGKTTIQVSLGAQLMDAGVRTLVFTRNESFRKKLPRDKRDLCTVLRLDDLRICPSEPEYLPTTATVDSVQAESRKTIGRWLSVFGRRFQRQDSIKLLQNVAELAYQDLGTFTTAPESRQYPAFTDINLLVQSRKYRERLGGKSSHEESAALALGEWERWGQGIFDSRQGMPWLTMLKDKNLIIETAKFREEDALMAIEFLLGSIWQAKVLHAAYTQALELVIVLDDFQGALDPESVVERLIRESRHAGLSFIMGPQNIGRVSPDIIGNTGLFVIAGAMSGKQDLDQARTLMGIGYHDELNTLLLSGQPGLALARQPMGAYKTPVLVKTPLLPEADYPEEERQQRLGTWLTNFKWTPFAPIIPQAPTPSTIQHAPASSQPLFGGRDFDDLVKQFVLSANEHWHAPMEVHFANSGVRDGSLKKSVSEHARALGLTVEPEEGRVMGLNGKRIQLTQVTPLARERFNLAVPESFEHCRGSLSTRYYQFTLSNLLKNSIACQVELEGSIGKEMKKADIVARLESGRAIVIEFASCKNHAHELHNIRALRHNPQLIAKYLVVCETLQVRDVVQRQLLEATLLPDNRVVITTFFEFAKNPKEFLRVA